MDDILAGVFRFGLLPRIAVALTLVGLLPACISWLFLAINQDLVYEQVQRTHAVAARSTAERIDTYLAQHQDLAASLASNPLLVEDPRAESSQAILRATLQSDTSLTAIILKNQDGEDIIRAQRPTMGEMVDWVETSNDGGPVWSGRKEGRLWVRIAVPLESLHGSLALLHDAQSLDEAFRPEELGPQALLALVDKTRKVLLGSREPMASDLVDQAIKGRLAGSSRFTLPNGQSVLGAYSPLSRAPWTVISSQPTRQAEELSLRIRRSVLLAAALALGLALALVAASHRTIVQPLRGILEAQRRLGGAGDPASSGNEIQQLRRSFEVLEERVRDREALGEVFLGRYQVVDVIASGAMGTVFRGWDPKLERPVALKTVRLGDPGENDEVRSNLVSTLLREAVTGARFNHPHIVSIYDVQDTSDAAFVAMELVEGVTLDRLLFERELLTPQEAVPMGTAVAEALAAAHDQGLVHRDVKPGNVLLGYDGSIKVSDFGIAAFISSLSGSKDRVFGTPGYLSPEVIRGEPHTPVSDLFAVGVLLYQSLTGVQPYYDPRPEQALVNTVRVVPDAPRSLESRIPEELDSLIMSLLSREPSRRPQGAREVAQTLGSMARTEGWRWRLPIARISGSRPTPPSSPATRWLPTVEL